jgi:HEAT repeat protein
MKRQNTGLVEKNVRSLVGMALQSKEDDELYWECVGKLQLYRCEDQVVWIRRNFESRNWRKRVLAVNIICQLGRPLKDGLPWEPLQLELAREVLGRALRDQHWRVVEAGLFGLGHREFPEHLPEMLRYIDDPHEGIRHGLSFSLGGYPQPEATEALLRLMHDEAREVRNWATFGLASLSEQDGPAIRDGLLAASGDADPEIRGEALIGLAQRRDERVKERVMRELQGEFHGSWAIDAAALLADQGFLPALESLKTHPEVLADGYFSFVLADAIAACASEAND